MADDMNWIFSQQGIADEEARRYSDWQARRGGGGTTAAAPPAAAPGLGTSLGDLKSGIAGMIPKGWEAFGGPLGQSLDLAGGLANEENRRYDETKTFLTRQFDKANQADQGMGQDEINQRMGRATDAATGQSLDNWKGLRDQLGAAGITGGGLAAGLGGQIELGRLAQIQGSKRDIAIAESERRSKSASDQFMRAMGLGAFMNESPSMLGLDQFNSVLDFASNINLGQKEIDVGYANARAQKSAGKSSMFGSIIGGLLGGL